jgi:DNA-binding NarL/FixJ family response regulator
VRRVRVVVVEDHQALRESVVELLDLVGFEVVGTAADGANATAVATRLTPDVVLMDLSLPVLNGLDATRLLCEALPNTAIVVFSAFESAELKRQAFAAGAVAYLVKDCTPERLLAALDGAVVLAGSRLGQVRD